MIRKSLTYSARSKLTGISLSPPRLIPLCSPFGHFQLQGADFAGPRVKCFSGVLCALHSCWNLSSPLIIESRLFFKFTSICSPSISRPLLGPGTHCNLPSTLKVNRSQWCPPSGVPGNTRRARAGMTTQTGRRVRRKVQLLGGSRSIRDLIQRPSALLDPAEWNLLVAANFSLCCS